MAAVIGSKAKPIDKVLDAQDDLGFEDVIVWPSSASDANKKQVSDEDLLDYGYGDATPSSANHQKTPRRSSLSSQNDPAYRSNRRASIGYTGEMTLVLPVTKQTVTKRRSITFSDDDTVHSCDSYDDPDEDNEILNNRRQLWFREEEYRHIERNIRTMVKDSRNSSKKERPTWIELRGLEGCMDDTAAAERHTAILSVLEDQHRQREAGFFDEHSIAMEYQYNTVDAQLVANARAKRDEKDIKKYMEGTRKVNRKLQHRRLSC